MTLPTPWLAGLTVVSAALAIAAAPWGLDAPTLKLVFKPLTTLLIIAHAWPRGRGEPATRRWVLAGLVLSLAGDVALLWPEEGFVAGLVSFLLAHLAYLWAFTRGHRLAAPPWPFVAYGLLAAAILTGLWPSVPAGLRLPVLAYVVCLASMAAQAGVVALRSRGSADAARGRVLAVGGALFLSSDTLLAIDRFAAPWPTAGLAILATYWAAQWCIASWLRRDGSGVTSP